jgi:hypothetical protein
LIRRFVIGGEEEEKVWIFASEIMISDRYSIRRLALMKSWYFAIKSFWWICSLTAIFLFPMTIHFLPYAIVFPPFLLLHQSHRHNIYDLQRCGMWRETIYLIKVRIFHRHNVIERLVSD